MLEGPQTSPVSATERETQSESFFEVFILGKKVMNFQHSLDVVFFQSVSLSLCFFISYEKVKQKVF